jgi:4-aminobutyrate aminotransferase-like enzyme
LSCGTYGQVVRIIPPLVTTDTEVDSAISAMSEGLGVIGS